jgi:hypothetical protein
MLGIVGGIAPPSTIEYYRRFIDGYRERTGGAYPPLLITSIDLRRMLSLVEADDRTGAVAFLAGEVKRLAGAGADVALFASNTPHRFFREVEAVAPIRLISIVEAARDAAKARGLRRVGLLGARTAGSASPVCAARRRGFRWGSPRAIPKASSWRPKARKRTSSRFSFTNIRCDSTSSHRRLEYLLRRGASRAECLTFVRADHMTPCDAGRSRGVRCGGNSLSAGVLNGCTVFEELPTTSRRL